MRVGNVCFCKLAIAERFKVESSQRWLIYEIPYESNLTISPFYSLLIPRMFPIKSQRVSHLLRSLG